MVLGGVRGVSFAPPFPSAPASSSLSRIFIRLPSILRDAVSVGALPVKKRLLRWGSVGEVRPVSVDYLNCNRQLPPCASLQEAMEFGKWPLVALGVLLVCSLTSTQSDFKEPTLLNVIFGETFLALESLTRVFSGIITRSDTRRTRSIMGQKRMPRDHHFMCDTEGFRSETPPESVHRLMPGDIDIVAAMGDSLTAGNGAFATNIPQLLVNNRGISWSIGMSSPRD
ncbi:hypothetical protein J437_LFUL002720 [Ladona fulva]|uniref:Uncharacterized protein n=1 Tax=Ladona fulva TaxID=123851 RepID=A0A8K0NY33_LADFU|nr:hypothetical protein J437_LFUL002720 [Ladona fulva]